MPRDPSLNVTQLEMNEILKQAKIPESELEPVVSPKPELKATTEETPPAVPETTSPVPDVEVKPEPKPEEKPKEEPKLEEVFAKVPLKIGEQIEEREFKTKEELIEAYQREAQKVKAADQKFMEAARIREQTQNQIIQKNQELVQASKLISDAIVKSEKASALELESTARELGIPVSRDTADALQDGDAEVKSQVLRQVNQVYREYINRIEMERDQLVRDQEFQTWIEIAEDSATDPVVSAIDALSPDPKFPLGTSMVVGLLLAEKQAGTPVEKLAQRGKDRRKIINEAIDALTKKKAEDVILSDMERARALLPKLKTRYPQAFEEHNQGIIHAYLEDQKKKAQATSPTLEGGGSGSPPSKAESVEITGSEKPHDLAKKLVGWIGRQKAPSGRPNPLAIESSKEI